MGAFDRDSYEPIAKPKRVKCRAVLANVERRWCLWCGRYPADPNEIHAAHVRSRGAGGDDTTDNVVGLCWQCHDAHHRGNEPTADQLRERLAAERTTAGR